MGIPLALFAAAFLLRLIGIGWGLKNELHRHSYHPDEAVVYAYSQQVEPAKLDFTPGFYNYGTFYLTLLRVTSDMVAVYGGRPENVVLGPPEVHNPGLEEGSWDYISRCHLAGRILNALAGAGTAVVVFLILRRRVNLIGALAGAAAIAVAPAHVVHSRFQTVDVMGTFLLALSALYALRLIPEEGTEEATAKDALKWSLLSGAFAGLSAGTKYTGGLIVLSLLAALFLTRRRDVLRLGAAGLLAAAVAFVFSTPGVLLESAVFWEHFRYEMRHTAEGHGLVFEGTASGFLVHLAHLFFGLGLLLGAMGVAGLALAGYRRKVWALALLAFFVPYYILIGRAEVKFLRYTFPLYVGVAAGFGWLVGRAHERQGWGRAVVAGGIAAVLGLDPGGLRGAATMTTWMLDEDPRDAAARYLQKAGAAEPSSTVGLVSDPWFYTPALFPDSASPRWYRFPIRLARMAEAPPPRPVLYIPPEGPQARFDWDTRLLTEAQPSYVVFSSFEQGDLARLAKVQGLRPEVQGQVDRYRQFRAELEARYEPNMLYAPNTVAIHDLQYIRPTVWIWKRKQP